MYKIQVNYHPIKVEESASKSSKIDSKPYLRIMEQIDNQVRSFFFFKINRLMNLNFEQYASTDRGDMLIFLSGMAEIQTVMEATQTYAQETQRWIILPLHSALSLEEQDKVKFLLIHQQIHRFQRFLTWHRKEYANVSLRRILLKHQ